MNQDQKERLFRCFCEARKTQGFFSSCLDQSSTKEERDVLIELVQDYTRASNKIKDYCLENYHNNP